jgi:hypothetical protein
LVELKELYDAQKLLSAELGGKLEKTQVPFKVSTSWFFILLARMLHNCHFICLFVCRKTWMAPGMLCMI